MGRGREDVRAQSGLTEGDDERARPHVAIDLNLFREPVRLIELASDDRFARAEIIRAPRVSSPVALTIDELEAIEDALPRSAFSRR